MNKKANMAYWDVIDEMTENYVRRLMRHSVVKINPYGSSYTEEDIEEMDADELAEAKDEAIMEIAKEITSFATQFLEKNYGAEFPYVDENY